MSTCIFCQIADGRIPAKIVYEDDQVFAFNDISPQAPLHVLICPKKHIPTLNDLTAEDHPVLGRIFETAARIAREAGVHERGYRTIFNVNKEAGQTVFHLHLHVMGGRFLGDSEVAGDKRDSGRVIPMVSDEEMVVIDRGGRRSFAKMLNLSDSGTLVYLMEDGDIGAGEGDDCMLSLHHQDRVFNALAALVRRSGHIVAFRFVQLDEAASSELQTKLLRMEVAWTRMQSRL